MYREGNSVAVQCRRIEFMNISLIRRNILILHFISSVCIFLPLSFPVILLTPSLSRLIRFIIKLQISLNPAISSESSPLFAVSRPLAYICPSALCFCASNYNTRSLPEETKQS